jgi:hypothetical protein
MICVDITLGEHEYSSGKAVGVQDIYSVGAQEGTFPACFLRCDVIC